MEKSRGKMPYMKEYKSFQPIIDRIPKKEEEGEELDFNPIKDPFDWMIRVGVAKKLWQANKVEPNDWIKFKKNMKEYHFLCLSDPKTHIPGAKDLPTVYFPHRAKEYAELCRLAGEEEEAEAIITETNERIKKIIV